MRNKIVRVLMFPAMLISVSGCVNDDTILPPYTPLVFLEDFEEAEDGTVLDIAGWTQFTASGEWTEQLFDGNGYAEFSVNASGESPTVSWLISPAVNLGEVARMLSFQSAQHHLTPEGAKMEVFIANDYNENDITSATWQPLNAVIADVYNDWYKFINSGSISLAGQAGTVHIAFKVTIDDGASNAAYFIDNIKVY